VTFEEIHKAVADKFGERVGPLLPAKKDAFAVVKADAIVEVCRFLKEDPALAFDCLMNLSAVDGFKSQPMIRVVYHLYSYSKRHAFILKVELDRADPSVPSVESVWKSADWLEREQYDLLGVKFEGHPDLRRIMLPDDWVGHPLRKDYKEPGEYHHISHLRESPLDGFVRLDELKKKIAAEKAAETAAPKKELLQ
jgi:NADH-quinone oxidoreductase subunit C